MSFVLPTKILMATIFRDGGSYALMYLGADGNEHLVYLQVARVDGEVVGYEVPTLRNQNSGASLSLSWSEASNLAASLLPLVVPPISECGVVRAQECVAILARGTGA